MKKALMLAVSAMCMSAPAFAMSDSDMKMMNDQHFKMMDANGDGMVSKDEMAAMDKKMMMDADTNKDGMMSKDEMMAMGMKHQKMMKDGMSKDGMMNK